MVDLYSLPPMVGLSTDKGFRGAVIHIGLMAYNVIQLLFQRQMSHIFIPIVTYLFGVKRGSDHAVKRVSSILERVATLVKVKHDENNHSDESIYRICACVDSMLERCEVPTVVVDVGWYASSNCCLS